MDRPELQEEQQRMDRVHRIADVTCFCWPGLHEAAGNR